MPTPAPTARTPRPRNDMHIVLTDILTCPRCGPEHGLILRADRVVERRVLDGVLGCPNCREQYPIRGGFGDLRPPLPNTGPWTGTADGGDRGDVVRLAALLGVSEGPAFVLLMGPVVQHAAELAALVDGIEVVAVDAGLADQAERFGVNRIGASAELPFASRKLPAVALAGAAATTFLEEGARLVGPLGRLVLEDAPANVEARLQAVGMRVLARESDTVVAVHG